MRQNKNWIYLLLTILIISMVVLHYNYSVLNKKNLIIEKIKVSLENKKLITSREKDRNPLNRWLLQFIYFFTQDDYYRKDNRECLLILEKQAQEGGEKSLKCFQNLKKNIDLSSLDVFRIDFSIKTLPVICKVKDKYFCEKMYDEKDTSCVTTYRNCSDFVDSNSDPPNSIYFLSIQEVIDLENENQK